MNQSAKDCFLPTFRASSASFCNDKIFGTLEGSLFPLPFFFHRILSLLSPCTAENLFRVIFFSASRYRQIFGLFPLRRYLSILSLVPARLEGVPLFCGRPPHSSLFFEYLFFFRLLGPETPASPLIPRRLTADLALAPSFSCRVAPLGDARPGRPSFLRSVDFLGDDSRFSPPRRPLFPAIPVVSPPPPRVISM